MLLIGDGVVAVEPFEFPAHSQLLEAHYQRTILTETISLPFHFSKVCPVKYVSLIEQPVPWARTAMRGTMFQHYERRREKARLSSGSTSKELRETQNRLPCD
jgi:hypothetical protein